MITSQQISIQPQIINFTTDRKQEIKITNRRQQKIKNCFFCLYNTSRYQFNPENFQLEPLQSKIIYVTFLCWQDIKQVKQFGYLKSKNFSQRISFIKNMCEPQSKYNSPSHSDLQDVYTLSSKQYRQTQKAAYNKVIAQKQAYIKRLQMKLEDQQEFYRKDRSFTSQRKKQNYDYQLSNSREKQMLYHQNQLLKEKVLQLQNVKYYHSKKGETIDRQNKTSIHEQTIQKLKQQIYYLQGEYENLLIIKKNNQQIIKNQRNKNMVLKQQYEKKLKQFIEKIKDKQIFQSKIYQFQQQVKNKQKQIDILMKKLQNQKNNRKLYQSQRQKLTKVQYQNDILKQQNTILRSQLQLMQKSMDEMKQQTFLLKNRIQPSQQRKQGQRSWVEQKKYRRESQNKIEQLQHQIKGLYLQITQLKNQKEQLVLKERTSKDQSHQTIMKLRAQNIDLIQKITFEQKKDDNKQHLLQKIKADKQLIQKLTKKLSQYKKQTKYELKNISQNTLDELKKIKIQKKWLKQKILLLQNTLQQFYHQHSKEEQLYPFLSVPIHHSNQNQSSNKVGPSDRKIGIKNQKKSIQQCQTLSKGSVDPENIYAQLSQLRQFRTKIQSQMSKLQNILALEDCSQFSPQSLPSYRHIFDAIYHKIKDKDDGQRKRTESIKQVQYLKGRLYQLQNNCKYTKQVIQSQDKISQIQIEKLTNNGKLLEVIKQEMKQQYKKMSNSLKISQQKFQILKKKIFQQYRLRIIGIINGKQSKDKLDTANRINRIQTILQKFVQNLGNRSHKQALLAKQIRLKQQAKKQVHTLRDKLIQLSKQLEIKKGYCTRQPIKVYDCQNQPQWHDNIRLSAKILTYQAQNIRLLQEINLVQLKYQYYQQQHQVYAHQLSSKQQQIVKLKKYVIDIQKQNNKQLLKRQQDIKQLQKKYIKQNTSQYKQKNSKKCHQKSVKYEKLKQDIDRKKYIIKNLKQKQKMLEQLVQSSNRSNSTYKSNAKKQAADQARIHDSIQQLLSNNRQLRSQNSKLKQQQQFLRLELQKKSNAFKKVKVEVQQSKIRVNKINQDQTDNLKSQNIAFKEQLKLRKNQIQNFRNRKQKQILQLHSEVRRLKNQAMIQKSSLQSIVRALSDSIRRVYSDLLIMARKKGCFINKEIDFEQLLKRPGQIDSIRVYESFQEILSALKS